MSSKRERAMQWLNGSMLAVGIAIGAGLGVAIGNLSMGVGIGGAIGLVFSGIKAKKRDRP